MRPGSALFNGQPVLVALAGEDCLNLSVVIERFHDVSEVLAAPDWSGGVGFARKPPVFLRPVDTVTVTMEGIVELVNDVVDELQP